MTQKLGKMQSEKGYVFDVEISKKPIAGIKAYASRAGCEYSSTPSRIEGAHYCSEVEQEAIALCRQVEAAISTLDE